MRVFLSAILEASGPATGLPAPGCWCPTCATLTRAGTTVPPAHLHLPSPSPAASPARAASAPPPSPASAARGWTLDVRANLHGPHGSMPLAAATRLTDELTAEALPGAVLLTSPSATVLWAPTPHPELARALRGRPLTTAYLGPPLPAQPEPPEDELLSPLQLLGRLIASLRAAGAVTDATELAVVALHETPSTLPLVLQAWGAHRPLNRAVPGRPLPRLTGRIVLLGGSGSGKSALAEDLLAAEPDVVYVATGPAPTPDDPEWTRRVDRHRLRRPAWWITEECSAEALAPLLLKEDRPVLLDSAGSWLTAALDLTGAWDDRPGWRAHLAELTSTLVGAWRARRAPLVAVTEEVGWAVVAPTRAGRLFTTELGRLNQRLAASSESLHVIVAGRVLS